MQTRSVRPAAILAVVALVVSCFTQPAAAGGDEPPLPPALKHG